MSPYQDNMREKQAIAIGVILILLVGAYFIGKNLFFSNADVKKSIYQPSPADTLSDTQTIAQDVLFKKIQNNEPLVLADIRGEEAFALGHIAHSLSVPIGSLNNFAPAKDEALIIIYSQADQETLITAKNVLSGAPFPYFFLADGLEGWLAAGYPLVTPGDPNSFVDQSKVNYIKVEEYKTLATTSPTPPFILDVQTEENYKKKHIKGALNIPLDTLEKRVDEIPAGKQIVVYGENSFASFQGGVRLSDLGIFTARTLEGNTHLSPASGLPLEP